MRKGLASAVCGILLLGCLQHRIASCTRQPAAGVQGSLRAGCPSEGRAAFSSGLAHVGRLPWPEGV